MGLFFLKKIKFLIRLKKAETIKFAYLSANRHSKFFIPPIAQSVEQLPLKQTVAGSSPAGRTKGKFKFRVSYIF